MCSQGADGGVKSNLVHGSVPSEQPISGRRRGPGLVGYCATPVEPDWLAAKCASEHGVGHAGRITSILRLLSQFSNSGKSCGKVCTTKFPHSMYIRLYRIMVEQPLERPELAMKIQGCGTDPTRATKVTRAH